MKAKKAMFVFFSVKLLQMKKIFKVLAQLLIVTLLGYGFYKSYGFYKQNEYHRIQARKETLSGEKPFVVIILSCNSAKYCEKNILSVLSQTYDNYRILCIDDHSDDNSYEKIQEIVAKSPYNRKFSLIKNDEKQGPLSCLFSAIKTINDDEIIVLVQGNDFLAHEQVLSKLNRIYNSPFNWMTYGNFLDYPSYKQMPIKCKPYPKNIVFSNSYRSHEFLSTHLHTFYAGLFKQIREEDLIYNGRFISHAWDLAIIIPMLEMSGKHAHYVNDVLYLYNRPNLTDEQKSVLHLQTEYIKKLPKYKRLKQLPSSGEKTKVPL